MISDKRPKPVYKQPTFKGWCVTARNRFGTSGTALSNLAQTYAVATTPPPSDTNSPHIYMAMRKLSLACAFGPSFDIWDGPHGQGSLIDAVREARTHGKKLRLMFESGAISLPIGRPPQATWVSGTTYKIENDVQGPTSNLPYSLVKVGTGASTSEPTHTRRGEVVLYSDGYAWQCYPDWMGVGSTAVESYISTTGDPNIGDQEVYLPRANSANFVFWAQRLGEGLAYVLNYPVDGRPILDTIFSVHMSLGAQGENELKLGYNNNYTPTWLGSTGVLQTALSTTSASVVVTVNASEVSTTNGGTATPGSSSDIWRLDTNGFALLQMRSGTSQTSSQREPILVNSMTYGAPSGGLINITCGVVDATLTNPATVSWPTAPRGRGWFGTFSNNTNAKGHTVGVAVKIMKATETPGSSSTAYYRRTFNGQTALFDVVQLNRRQAYDFAVTKGATPDTAAGQTGVETWIKDDTLAGYKLILDMILSKFPPKVCLHLSIDSFYQDHTYATALCDYYSAQPVGRVLFALQHLIAEANTSSDPGGTHSPNDVVILASAMSAGHWILYQYDGACANGDSGGANKGSKAAAEDVLVAYPTLICVEGPRSRITAKAGLGPYRGWTGLPGTSPR